MNHNFKCVSLSHRKAPVDVRERFHFSDDQARVASLKIREVTGVEELLLISTCNRTEIYYLHEEDLAVRMVKLLCIEKGIDNPGNYLPFFDATTDHFEAVKRLFEVSIGLDSAVIGDLQISNQIKQAYTIAHELQLAGPFMHRILHTIFHTHKRVHQETAYRDGAASVSYAAAELAGDLTLMHASPSVLVVGLGEMGRDVALTIGEKGFGRICLMNRSFDKAEALAAQLEAECAPLEELAEQLCHFDVVITALSVETPIITRALAANGEGRQQFFIDLSVPRAIAGDVEEIAGILVYDIDDIRSRTDEVVQRRRAAVPQVKAIIETEMAGFLDWSKELSISPTIQRLKEALEEIRKEELARFLKNADDKEKELVEKVTISMMNKIIKLPVLQLKAACKRGEEENLIGVLSDLFNLEKESESV